MVYRPYISMGSSDTIMYLIFNEEGKEVANLYDESEGPLDVDNEDMTIIKDNLDKGVFIWLPPPDYEDKAVQVRTDYIFTTATVTL